LNIHLFTNGKKMPGVETFSGEYGYKWGRYYVRSKKDLATAVAVLKKSHKLINYCIERNIPTGWYAEVD